jgi:hypothetical protein
MWRKECEEEYLVAFQIEFAEKVIPKKWLVTDV